MKKESIDIASSYLVMASELIEKAEISDKVKKNAQDASNKIFQDHSQEEIFEAIKQKLIENKCFACDYYTSIEKYYTTIVKSCMDGKTIYPEIKRSANPHGYYVDLTKKLLNLKKQLILESRKIDENAKQYKKVR